MLSATLYRFRRSLLKHPWKILVALIFIGLVVFMLFYPTIMALPESDGTPSSEIVPRNVSLVTGGLYLIQGAMFTFMAYTGIVGGVGGLSVADVNFHLAGPFTKKFNLWLAAIGALSTCVMLMFLLSCQTAIIYSVLGVSTIDLLALWLGVLANAFIGYFLGAWFGVKFVEDDKKKYICQAVLLITVLIPVLAAIIPVLLSNDGFSISAAVTNLGKSAITKFFPVFGWIGMIYDGIINDSIIYTVVGSFLTIATVVGLIVLYNKSDLDYYEPAIAAAMKVEELREAKRAGIDSDTARVNNKLKVGKESLGGGEGAYAFASLHLLMNKRATRFSFVNPLAFLYRIITVVYMIFFMKTMTGPDDEAVGLVSALVMTLILNSVIYGGGKTVLEFSKPYIYLVPEKSSKKILACLIADIPEMLFDSVICVLTFYILLPNTMTVSSSIAFFFMMMVYDILCELFALVVLRVFNNLGKYMLMIVRYLGIMIMCGFATIIGMIFMDFFGITIALVAIAVIGLVLDLLMLIPASKVVDKAEI